MWSNNNAVDAEEEMGQSLALNLPYLPLNPPGTGSAQPISKSQQDMLLADARWSEAGPVTVALWFFVLLIYSPMILERHRDGGLLSIVLDSSTILVSIAIALCLFGGFRKTLHFGTRQRFVLLALMILSASLVQLMFDRLFTAWVAQHIELSWRLMPGDVQRIYGALFNYICVYSVNVALFHLIFTQRQQLRQERKLANARGAAQQAQLAALRYQLNPHFLFNTLNAISAMIVTRRNEEAEDMTERLSNFLRASLSSDPTELATLDAELSIIEEYLEIEAIRFGDRLKVAFDSTDEAGAVMMPSFLLQPLVENAIKYGVAPSRRPVELRVAARVEDGRLLLVVEDDGEGNIEDALPGTGVGLDNIRKRLMGTYGAAAQMTAESTGSGFRVTIRLPIRPPSGRA